MEEPGRRVDLRETACTCREVQPGDARERASNVSQAVYRGRMVSEERLGAQKTIPPAQQRCCAGGIEVSITYVQTKNVRLERLVRSGPSLSLLRLLSVVDCPLALFNDGSFADHPSSPRQNEPAQRQNTTEEEDRAAD